MDNDKKQGGDAYEVPKEGSLGLLALGDMGLTMWREVRSRAQKAKKDNDEQETGQ